MSYTTINRCRLCEDSNLKDVYDLGEQYVVDFPEAPDQNLLKAPLKLVSCETCNLVQLEHSVDKERLFRKFWYRSTINPQMQTALREIVQRAMAVTNLNEGDPVLDIGANDGTLLGWYPGIVRTVGIDPCKELVDEGVRKERMDIGIPEFFSQDAVRAHGPYKVITAIAMMYDLEDPIHFLSECREVLHEEGVMIVQMNYLPTMLNQCSVDNICHEHVTYFSMHSVQAAAHIAGFDVAGAETNSVNGGSFRVYLTHKGKNLAASGQMALDLLTLSLKLLHNEQRNEIGLTRYRRFSAEVGDRMNTLRDYLKAEAAKDAKIYVYGASTRGTVLLQLLDLPPGVLHGVADRDPNKHGRYMVGGSWPKIYSEDYCRKRATHFLVLPHHFRESIMEREEDWMEKGGKLIFPLPIPEMRAKGGKQVFLKAKEQVSA